MFPCGAERVRALLRDGAGLATRLAPAARLRALGPGVYGGEIALGAMPFARRHPVRVRIAEVEGAIEVLVQGHGRSQGLAIAVRCELEPVDGGAGTRLRYRVRTELGGLREALGKGGMQRRVSELLDGLRDAVTTSPGQRPVGWGGRGRQEESP